MGFHMYSSERFLSYGLSYLDEKVNNKALEELQALKLAELEVLKRQQMIAEREKELEMVGIEKRKLTQLKLKLRELKERIFSIEQQQKVLEIDAQENPEAQEYIHSLSIQKSELQEQMRSLRQQLEKLFMQEEMIRLREKEYEFLLRKLRDKDK